MVVSDTATPNMVVFRHSREMLTAITLTAVSLCHLDMTGGSEPSEIVLTCLNAEISAPRHRLPQKWVVCVIFSKNGGSPTIRPQMWWFCVISSKNGVQELFINNGRRE